MSEDQDLKIQNNDLDDLKDQIQERNEIIKENEQRIDECQDQLLRMQADLENYRKHTEKRMKEHLERANQDIIIKILETGRTCNDSTPARAPVRLSPVRERRAAS